MITMVVSSPFPGRFPWRFQVHQASPARFPGPSLVHSQAYPVWFPVHPRGQVHSRSTPAQFPGDHRPISWMILWLILDPVNPVEVYLIQLLLISIFLCPFSSLRSTSTIYVLTHVDRWARHGQPQIQRTSWHSIEDIASSQPCSSIDGAHLSDSWSSSSGTRSVSFALFALAPWQFHGARSASSAPLCLPVFPRMSSWPLS